MKCLIPTPLPVYSLQSTFYSSNIPFHSHTCTFSSISHVPSALLGLTPYSLQSSWVLCSITINQNLFSTRKWLDFHRTLFTAQCSMCSPLNFAQYHVHFHISFLLNPRIPWIPFYWQTDELKFPRDYNKKCKRQKYSNRQIKKNENENDTEEFVFFVDFRRQTF